MSDLYGMFIVSVIYGIFSGIIFYIIKDVINQFKKINELKKEIEKIS